MTSMNDTSNTSREIAHFGLAWALKRALLGIVILAIMFGGGAWLLYATIEPDRADASESVVVAPIGQPRLASE